MENNLCDKLEYIKIEKLPNIILEMPGFEKNCPVCKKPFTSLLEYTTHIGKDHRDIPAEDILKMNKEQKWSISDG